MLTSDAITYFDDSVLKLAAAIGVKAPSIYSWGPRVPWRRQIQLERMTRGALKHRAEDVPCDMLPLVPAMLGAPLSEVEHAFAMRESAKASA